MRGARATSVLLHRGAGVRRQVRRRGHRHRRRLECSAAAVPDRAAELWPCGGAATVRRSCDRAAELRRAVRSTGLQWGRCSCSVASLPMVGRGARDLPRCGSPPVGSPVGSLTRVVRARRSSTCRCVGAAIARSPPYRPEAPSRPSIPEDDGEFDCPAEAPLPHVAAAARSGGHRCGAGARPGWCECRRCGRVRALRGAGVGFRERRTSGGIGGIGVRGTDAAAPGRGPGCAGRHLGPGFGGCDRRGRRRRDAGHQWRGDVDSAPPRPAVTAAERARGGA